MKKENLLFITFFLFAMACTTTKSGQLNKSKQLIIAPLTKSTEASFRGIASWGANDLWIGGTDATILHSSDQGKTIKKIVVPNADSLDFRDIEVLDKNTILLMSIGNGSDSRIYKTIDGGKNWNITFQNEAPKAFFDGIDFWDDRKGMMISDPIDDKLLLFKTEDAGETWNRVGATTLPILQEGEYGFAASGTGIVTINNKVWISTGGAAARVFSSADAGQSWKVINTPVVAGNSSAGIFSIAFRDALHGVAIGGDYLNPNVDEGNIAITADGGESWQRIKNDPPIFHKACVQHLGGTSFLATGRTGTALSRDDGKHWEVIEEEPYYCITFDVESGIGYMAGPKGNVARLSWK